MTNLTMQQAAAHYFGIAWDELNQFEQAHWEAAWVAGRASETKQAAEAGKWDELKRLATEQCISSDLGMFEDHQLCENILELIAENERLKGDLKDVEPSFADVERLCKVLGYLGVATPESGHEQAARWLSLVRTLIRTAETSKLLRHDAEAVAEYTQLKAENEALSREAGKPSATNTGHGHVFPRPDGVRARCGGPGMCSQCALDLARKEPSHD